MTFNENIKKSVSRLNTLVEIDIGTINVQWVNAGAGIWKVNFDNSYPEIDSSLLDGFTAQIISNIGSVRCDSVFLTKVSTLASMSLNTRIYYYDLSSKTLYVCLQNYDEPFLHNVWLGVVSGFSKKEFTPTGAAQIYEGRLLSIPTFGYNRDPLYFGKNAYESINISMVNADGMFDTFAVDNDVYGNYVRILMGYEGLDYNDYELLYTGFIENITVSEDNMSIQVSDPRKQLSKKVFYYCVAKNALDAIFDLLSLVFTVTYSNDFFNVAEWSAAKAVAPNVTLIILEESPEEVKSVIESICASVFGLFIIQADGRYSFKMIDTSATATTTIKRADILNDSISVSYDPSEVLSSIAVSYDVIFDETTNDFKTWITDTQYEQAVFDKYKIYVQKDFNTFLVDEASAQAFADKVMAYAKDVHGIFSVNIPMRYFNSAVFGGVIDVEINRENSIMIGTKKCEILGKTFDLENENIILNLRIC